MQYYCIPFYISVEVCRGCSCNCTILMAVIGILVAIITSLIIYIIWLRKKGKQCFVINVYSHRCTATCIFHSLFILPIYFGRTRTDLMSFLLSLSPPPLLSDMIPGSSCRASPVSLSKLSLKVIVGRPPFACHALDPREEAVKQSLLYILIFVSIWYYLKSCVILIGY